MFFGGSHAISKWQGGFEHASEAGLTVGHKALSHCACKIHSQAGHMFDEVLSSHKFHPDQLTTSQSAGAAANGIFHWVGCSALSQVATSASCDGPFDSTWI